MGSSAGRLGRGSGSYGVDTLLSLPVVLEIDTRHRAREFNATETPPPRQRPSPPYEAVQRPTRVNVTCVTPLGEEADSTS
ncbi:hypothetical protein GCM10010094_22220 [Streptomyces flaveus]|uniref:Uncharacterized protein n=1 Tax=Streptomyces flaveus TaxID=66370 RepID=A0A917QPW6_9ACTN|nr:hypothetical protein GCM10010094_22220 [Streptomyces flaveus]